MGEGHASDGLDQGFVPLTSQATAAIDGCVGLTLPEDHPDIAGHRAGAEEDEIS